MDIPTVDRRKAILGGVAATGTLVFAPHLSSVAAAGPNCSPNGCTPTNVNLLNSPFGNGVNITDGTARIVNGTSITASRASNVGISNGPGATNGSSAAQTTGVIANIMFGGTPARGQIPICQRNSTNASNSITINFNPGVRKLEFVVTDIDASTYYQEQITISYTNGTGDAAPTMAAGSGLTQVTQNVTYRSTSSSTNVEHNSTANNLTVVFDNCGTVTSVTILSADLKSSTSGTTTAGRMVGVTGFKWCV